MVLVQGSVVLAQTTSSAFMNTRRRMPKHVHTFTASPLIPSPDPSLPVLSTPPPLVLMSEARYNYKAPKVLFSLIFFNTIEKHTCSHPEDSIRLAQNTNEGHGVLLVEWHHLESEAGRVYGGDKQSNTLGMARTWQGECR